MRRQARVTKPAKPRRQLSPTVVRKGPRLGPGEDRSDDAFPRLGVLRWQIRRQQDVGFRIDQAIYQATVERSEPRDDFMELRDEFGWCPIRQAEDAVHLPGGHVYFCQITSGQILAVRLVSGTRNAQGRGH